MIDLTPTERNGSAVKKIVDHLTLRLSAMRCQNDGPFLDARETAGIRGKIAEIKDLLKALNPPADDESPGNDGR